MADPNNNRNSSNSTTPSPQQSNRDGQSTISYLPILFANGYPISLERMTEEQLELFIPFLVKCSLNLKIDEEPKEKPEWWPNDIKFRIPLEKPKEVKENWKVMMRNVVTECYIHHKQPFLLRYSKELSKNDTANLRYVKDSDTTTALWSRNPEKLLLTFRNDLMLYDKKKRRQLWKKDESVNESEEAESAFDMFLCDNCDATFVSEEAYTEHERKCNHTEEESEQAIENIVISDDDDEGEEDENESNDIELMNDQRDFMAYFYLAGMGTDELPHRNNSFLERSLSPKKKKKKAAPRTRKTISQKDREREFEIPFSSPAGIVVTKKLSDDEYVMDRLETIESYCQAKPTTRVIRTKIKYPQNNTEKTLMRQMRKLRPYYWPKRQLFTKSRKKNFEFLNRWLIEDCKPFDITLKKLSSEDIKSYKERLITMKQLKERASCVDLISDSENESIEMDDDVSEAMTKLNGQFLTLPVPSTSKILPTFSDYQDLPASKTILPSGEIRISRQSTTTAAAATTTTTIIQQNSVSFKSNVNNLIRSCENDIIERTSSKSIHEWLNNVNGENFQIANQLSLINS